MICFINSGGYFDGFVDCRFLPAVKGNRSIALLRDLTYVTNAGERITAKVGFISDGATVPRLFWRICGHPFSEYLEAAVLHDLSCNEAWDLLANGRKAEAKIHRRFADFLFLEMLEVLKVNPIKRRLMYHFVRIWGWLKVR